MNVSMTFSLNFLERREGRSLNFINISNTFSFEFF